MSLLNKKELRPAPWRNIILLLTFVFFEVFCRVSAYFELARI